MPNPEPLRVATCNPDGQSVARQSLDQFSQRPFLWFEYTQTPGLSGFRQQERYAVWLHTHRRLMETSRQYARGHSWFVIQAIGTVLFALTVKNSFVHAAPNADNLLALLSGGLVGWLVWHNEQLRRNREIGAELTGR